MKQKILSMRNNAIYQKLSAEFSQKNVFSILRIERNENRHSAFLCWLLDATASHGLGTEPLKKLLALYSCQKDNHSDLDTLFVSGNYTIEVEECTTEKMMNQIVGMSGQERFDIWMRIVVTDNDNKQYVLPVVIENKVYANEGKDQTNRYHQAVEAFLQNEQAASAIEIYLTPDDTKACGCHSFVQITYQQLLDYVIEPLSSYTMPKESQDLINAYIINLETPATKSIDEVKTASELANSVMAISRAKKAEIVQLFHEYKDLFMAALYAVGGSKVEKLGICPIVDTETAELLQNFWENNIQLFNTILFVCKDEIAPENSAELMNIFKSNHRDTTKYIVQWEITGDGQSDWKVVKGYEKPMSKSKTVAVFFQKWMELVGGTKSIDEIRQIFPTSLNSYYAANQKKKMYDSVIWHSKDDKSASSESGFTVDIDTQARWDLYPIVPNPKHNVEFGLGYGPVWKGMTLDGRALIVKMWRKDDFDNFVKYVENNPTYFSRVRIVKVC